MAALHQAGADRFYNFDKDLELDLKPLVKQVSLQVGVDLTIDAFSIDGFGFFKIIFLVVWFLHLLISGDDICSHAVRWSVMLRSR